MFSRKVTSFLKKDILLNIEEVGDILKTNQKKTP